MEMGPVPSFLRAVALLLCLCAGQSFVVLPTAHGVARRAASAPAVSSAAARSQPVLGECASCTPLYHGYDIVLCLPCILLLSVSVSSFWGEKGLLSDHVIEDARVDVWKRVSGSHPAKATANCCSSEHRGPYRSFPPYVFSVEFLASYGGASRLSHFRIGVLLQA